MASTDTFIQLVRSGKLLAEEIDDFVAAWHASNDSRTLPEALGFSNEEYALWVEQPGALGLIINAHHYGTPLDKNCRPYFGS
jgi:hypothetical protein